MDQADEPDKMLEVVLKESEPATVAAVLKDSDKDIIIKAIKS